MGRTYGWCYTGKDRVDLCWMCVMRESVVNIGARARTSRGVIFFDMIWYGASNSENLTEFWQHCCELSRRLEIPLVKQARVKFPYCWKVAIKDNDILESFSFWDFWERWNCRRVVGLLLRCEKRILIGGGQPLIVGIHMRLCDEKKLRRIFSEGTVESAMGLFDYILNQRMGKKFFVFGVGYDQLNLSHEHHTRKIDI